MAKLRRKPRYAPVDYTVNMLPKNRKQVFGDVIKLQWRQLLLYGLVFLAFCLPLHAVCLLEMLLVGNVTGGTDLEIIAASLSLKNQMALIKIPCFVLLAVGIAGFARIIRQHAWGENVFWTAEFSTGVKTNGLQMVLLGFLAGVVNALAVLAKNYVTMELINSGGENSFWQSVWMNLPVMVAILFGVPIAAYAVVVISIYKGGFGKTFATAMQMAVKSPLKNLLALVCCLVPFVVQLVPQLETMLMSASLLTGVLLRVLMTFAVPFSFLGWYLYACYQLDRHVNSQQFPHLVGKGIYKGDQEVGEQADGEQQTDGSVEPVNTHCSQNEPDSSQVEPLNADNAQTLQPGDNDENIADHIADEQKNK